MSSSPSMPPVPAIPDGINIDNLLGVILICLIIAAYLFGMSSSQAYIYYDRFPKDQMWIKALVGLIWALDSFHTALMSHTVYYYTVTNFGNFEALTTAPVFSFNLEILVVPVIAFIVQLWFAHRAFSIERNNWPLAAAIAIFAVAQLVFGIIACVLAFTKFDGFLDLGKHTWGLIAWLSTALVANLLVSISLIWTFWITKTSFTEEDGWMTKLLTYGVHTGLFTTITTIVDLGFVTAWPETLAFAGLSYILGKLYTNTMLYALNRRPVTDPRYIESVSGSNGQSRSKQHNLSSLMPQFNGGPNGGSGGERQYNPQYSFTAPRIQPKDPYAPGGGTDMFGLEAAHEYEQNGADVKKVSLTNDVESGEANFNHESDRSFVEKEGEVLPPPALHHARDDRQ